MSFNLLLTEPVKPYSRTAYYKTSGVWVVPPKVRRARFTYVGGAGGGYLWSGASGGAGYCAVEEVWVWPGKTIQIIVGAGGKRAANPEEWATNGGQTVVIGDGDTFHMVAWGGFGANKLIGNGGGGTGFGQFGTCDPNGVGIQGIVIVEW
ncbi:glycine-rich domain-containing protein [Chitinivorax sp. B]|uniref:glycine-rich domain-containing protein n=1 Tax=Chitinivorax sp. B TaxID=2502235 RepID=UPI0010F6A68C|nr:hypothetical protein [Chitinivorax sp. B]